MTDEAIRFQCFGITDIDYDLFRWQCGMAIACDLWNMLDASKVAQINEAHMEHHELKHVPHGDTWSLEVRVDYSPDGDVLTIMCP